MQVVTNGMWLLAPEAGRWTRVAGRGVDASPHHLPPPMHGHTATAVGSRLYVVGGRNGMEVFSRCVQNNLHVQFH